jgi:hypothetical protein
MKPVLDRYTVTRERSGVKPAETHVKLKKRHVKITRRPRGMLERVAAIVWRILSPDPDERIAGWYHGS